MKGSAGFQVNEKFFKEFISFRTYDEMKQIAEPLKKIGVEGFIYLIQYFDGRYSRLDNLAPLSRVYFQERFLEIAFSSKFNLPQALFLEKVLLDETGCHFQKKNLIWRFRNVLKHFSLSTAVALSKNYPDRIEYSAFRFSSEQENQLMALSYQYQDYLYRFVNYFQEKARKLLEQARRSTILLPWPMQKFESSLNECHLSS